MTKLFKITLVFFVYSNFVSAQQIEHYTQFQHNQITINPALTGQKKCIDVKTGYRLQWLGIDGAPNSGFASLTTPIKITRAKRSINAPKHGIGVMVQQDKIGPWSKIEMLLNYGIQISLNRHYKLSYGLSLGLKQLGFNPNEVTTALPDAVIFNSRRSLIFPDIKSGIWFNSENAYIGLSIHNLLRNKIKNVGSNNIFNQHYYLTAGKKFRLDTDWDFIPSILLIKTKATPYDGHLSLALEYKNILTLGLGMRRTDAITAQFRIKMGKIFSIGYSFDFIISKLQNQSWQSQEITMGYSPCGPKLSSRSTHNTTFE